MNRTGLVPRVLVTLVALATSSSPARSALAWTLPEHSEIGDAALALIKGQEGNVDAGDLEQILEGGRGGE